MAGCVMSEFGVLPGVIVLGVDSAIGLAVIRDLGRHGVPILAIGNSADSIGLRSRYVNWRAVRPSGGLQTWLPELAKAHDIKFVMAISESDILDLNAARHLMPTLKLLIPDEDKMAIVLDKRKTLAMAAELGIDVPQEWCVRHSDDVDPLAPALTWPLVLKWSDPQTIVSRLRSCDLPLIKAEFVLNKAQLKAALKRYDPLGDYPLIQSYAAGYGIGHMIFMAEGEPLLSFQHQRIHEWPPEGGTSTVCRSVAFENHDLQLQKSVALLKAMNWTGPAMVEYRHDPEVQKTVLMEINGRFWGSLPLAIHAGAHFPWLTFARLALGLKPQPPKLKIGVQARYMFAESRRLIFVMLRGNRIRDPFYKNTPGRDLVHYVTSFFDWRSHYYVWSLDDPKPFLKDMVQAVRKVFNLRKKP
jgi:predicted ATP-grasp superfamily ATP-dependent carboligase